MNHQTTRLSRWTGFFVVGLLLLGHTNQSWAQARTGTIAGKVTDATGAVLKGAQVSLEPQAVNVVSDEQGRFLISGLVPGQYTLTITYVGFMTFSKKVDVAAGPAIDVDATLQVQSESQTVLVTAGRATGEVEALNIERTADNIVQVLASEVIRSLPNANMADALGRLPSITLERDEGRGNTCRSVAPSLA
jgi:hypothetical protein